MKSIARDARVLNVTGAGSCRWCGDAGYVVVQTRKPSRTSHPRWKNALSKGAIEEMGPCPFCESGFREEFPVPKAGNKYATKPPWGEDGFWQGRDTSGIVPLYDSRVVVEKAPEWVKRWQRARAAGDQRPFPEQRDEMDPFDIPDAPESNREAWVQADEYTAAAFVPMPPLVKDMSE